MRGTDKPVLNYSPRQIIEQYLKHLHLTSIELQVFVKKGSLVFV